MVVSYVGRIQWGGVATWVASVGTVAAVVIALTQVYRERQRGLERDRADREKSEADSAVSTT